ncbi:MAG: carbon storage regulator [Pirellulales bacterium]
MLVLSRKVGESLCIGDNVTVTVVRIGPGIVRIGIDAPSEAVIARDELVPNRDQAPGSAPPGNGASNPADPKDC